MSAKTNPLLSACLIVKNEERFLPACLQSLQSIADEIIVVDTGSTDQTPAIAERFGAKVLHFPWCNDFAAARNFSLQHAQGEWILIIDADEQVINPEVVRPFLQQLSPQIGGVFVQLLSVAPVQSGSKQHVNYLVRIVRNHPDIRFEGVIHEQISPAIQKAGYHATLSPIQLYHRGYALTPEQMRAKAQRNLELLNAHLEAHPEDGYAWFQRGKTLLLLEQLEQAAADFDQALSLLPADHLARIQALNYRAWLAFHHQHFNTARQLVTESLKQQPEQAFAYYLLGELLFQTRQYEEALEAFHKMQAFAQKPSVSAAMAGELILPPAERHFLLGKTYLQVGQLSEAEKHFRAGIEHNPDAINCWIGLADWARRQRQYSQALEYLRKAQQIDPGHPQIPRYIAQVQAEMEQPNAAVSSPEPVLTGCILTNRFADTLRRAVQSLLPLCDRILIGFTAPLPSELPDWLNKLPAVEVHEIPWNEDFSAARNALLDRCRSQWVCMLDDDEEIPAESQQKIRSLLPRLSSTVGGVIVTMRHFAPGSEHPPETTVLRIFRLHPAIRYRGVIHEQISDAVIEAGFQVHYAPDIVFYHHTAPPTSEKIAFYRRLYEKGLQTAQTSQDRQFLLFHYLLFLLTLDKQPDTIAQAEQELLNNPDVQQLSAAQQATLWNALIRAKLADPDFAEISRLAERSIAIFPDQCEAYWYHFLAELSLQRPQTAFQSIQQYLERIEHYQSALPFEKLPPLSQVQELIEQAQRVYGAIVPILSASTTSNASTRSAPAEQLSDSTVAQPGAEAERSSTPLLSLCMIVRNEEQHLPGCLESVRGLVDEIIVVDTGSTDRTIEIAQQYGAQIFRIEWQNDFSLARNESIKHARGQWILYLDADERIDRSQIPMIRQLLEQAEEHIGAFACTIVSKHRLTDTDSSLHRGVYPRLFRNLGYPTIHFRGKVHEQISPSILEAGKTIAPSPIIIHHLGYDLPEAALRQKVQRNYQLLFEHIQQQPTDAYAWFQLGQTLSWMQLPEQAEEALRFSLQLTPPLPDYLQAAAYAILAQLAGRKRNFAQALEYAERSLVLAPDQLYARTLKAFALLHLGRKAEAKQLFEECLELLQHRSPALRAGFDIDVSESEIRKGLALCQ